MPKILVIRFSSIGDIVLTSPVVRCLHEQLGAEVHFLTKKSFATIVRGNPYIKKTFTIDRKVSEVISELKEEAYDYIVDLHKNLRSGQVRLALRKPGFSFDKINWEKWLIVNLKVNRLPTLHIVERYLEGVKKLGINNDGKGLDYFIPPEEEIALSDFFAKNPLADWESGYLAFAIGAAHATKRMPLEKIISLCKKIEKPVVLLGGPGDKDTGQRIAEAIGPKVLNTCGELSLNQSASLVRQARLVISHDTGMMHIAAAFQKPIISIWGNTIPEFGMYPFYPEGADKNISFEVKGLSCRPCSKIGSEMCPKGHFDCMLKLDIDLIAGTIKKAAKK